MAAGGSPDLTDLKPNTHSKERLDSAPNELHTYSKPFVHENPHSQALSNVSCDAALISITRASKTLYGRDGDELVFQLNEVASLDNDTLAIVLNDPQSHSQSACTRSLTGSRMSPISSGTLEDDLLEDDSLESDSLDPFKNGLHGDESLDGASSSLGSLKESRFLWGPLPVDASIAPRSAAAAAIAPSTAPSPSSPAPRSSTVHVPPSPSRRRPPTLLEAHMDMDMNMYMSAMAVCSRQRAGACLPVVATVERWWQCVVVCLRATACSRRGDSEATAAASPRSHFTHRTCHPHTCRTCHHRQIRTRRAASATRSQCPRLKTGRDTQCPPFSPSQHRARHRYLPHQRPRPRHSRRRTPLP